MSTTKTPVPVTMTGHVHIENDLGEVLLDKSNAVHPQNVARILSRALANENNSYIHRIAFGNGGTEVDAAFQITYNTPNDGQAPDTTDWRSRLYNETYSEIIDDSNVSIGTDPGSSGPIIGTRSGGGADPSGDPVSVEHVSGPGVRSNELGVTSQVIITSILNPGEPGGQFDSDQQAPGTIQDTESDFTFDEIGLFSFGTGGADSSGYQNVEVGDLNTEDDTGLIPGNFYGFDVTVDGGGLQSVTFQTPAGGGSGPLNEILFGDLCEAINTGDVAWNVSPAVVPATVVITDQTTGVFSTVPAGTQTFGFLKFESSTVGAASSVLLDDAVYVGDGTTAGLRAPLFGSFIPTVGVIQAAVDGAVAGVQNDPVNFTAERERLLTHILFSPILKSANRSISITYTLTISVARSF